MRKWQKETRKTDEKSRKKDYLESEKGEKTSQQLV